MFLKDVSKQTAEDLITYIYNGEVNVASECLANFLNVAKALNIKGLNGGSHSQSRESNSLKRTRSDDGSNGIQYQSTGINQPLGSKSSLKRTKPVQVCPTESNYFQSLTDKAEDDEDHDDENMKYLACNVQTNFDRKNGYAAEGDHSTEKDNGASFSQWWYERENDSNSNQNLLNVNRTIAQWPKQKDISKFRYFDRNGLFNSHGALISFSNLSSYRFI